MFYRRTGRQMGPKSEPTYPLPAISRLSQKTTPTLSPSQRFPGPWEGQPHVGSATRHLEGYGPRHGGVGAG